MVLSYEMMDEKCLNWSAENSQDFEVKKVEVHHKVCLFPLLTQIQKPISHSP
jgi:hypothetical protein